MDYQSDIEIDESQLDIEWLDHASRMFRYCRYAAEAQRDMDIAKESLELVKAQVERAVRADPEAFGIEARETKDGKRQAPTEGAINAAVLTDTEYKYATQRLIQTKFEYNIAQGAVKAFDHRKSALENLVRLHGQSYFAGPSVPRALSEERERFNERRRERDAAAQSKVRMRRS